MPTPLFPETRSAPLPESLRGLFWEHDFDSLSWDEERDLIFWRDLTGTGMFLLGW